MDYLFHQESRSESSGWTQYLDQSSLSPYNLEHDFHEGSRSRVSRTQVKGLEQEEGETEGNDEGLSMVSDASSGPPHFHEEEEGYGRNDTSIDYRNDTSFQTKRHKSKENRRWKKVQDRSSILDDTASSPLYDFSSESFNYTRSQPSAANVLEHSQGYSSTQFEVRPPYKEHYDFFQFPPSPSQLQQNQWFEGKMW